jgi:hypothetical protein
VAKNEIQESLGEPKFFQKSSAQLPRYPYASAT